MLSSQTDPHRCVPAVTKTSKNEAATRSARTPRTSPDDFGALGVPAPDDSYGDQPQLREHAVLAADEQAAAPGQGGVWSP